MMVTVPGDSALQPLLDVLNSKAAKVEDRVDAYITLTKHLSPKSESDGSVVQSIVEEVAGSSTEVVAALVRDIGGDSHDVTQVALQCLGLCAHYAQICSAMSDAETKSVTKSLCDTIYKTSDKTTCTRAIWCIAKQNFSRKVLEEELHALLATIEHGQCKKNFQSATVEYEALNAIIRLLEQLPLKMVPHAEEWGRLVYPLLLHHAPRVRERALMAMDIGTSAMLHQRDSMATDLLPDLKAMLISEMEKLMKAKHEIHVLKVWSFYVQILGKLLHSGSLINQMLPIVEMGFKNSNPTVKVAAYKAWAALVDNFAGNPDIIGDHKRVKLLMQVFRINNSKTENVAMEKLKCWWHFVCKLGDKASLYFEQVCVPLLHYSFHGTANLHHQTPGKAGPLGRTPNSKLAANPFSSPATPGSSGHPPPVFRPVQSVGAEVLAIMLGKTSQVPDGPKARFTLEPLENDVITGLAFFTKHAQVLISSVRDCITHLGSDLPEPLLLHIWYALVAHIKNVVEYAQKKDSVDIFTAFLTAFKDTVEGQCLPPDRLLKLFQAVMCLPAKVLSSSAYSIGGVMYGCPALSLLDLLFNHRILENTTSRERLYVLLEQIVACAFHSKASALTICQSTITAVDRVAGSSIGDKEALWRMWSIVANPLMEHIIKTNEVNQGNTLEHDFGCLYALLGFPVYHVVGGEIPQTTSKSLLITWSELYRTFARLAAMVANADGNVCCEELCQNIGDHLKQNPGKLKDVQFVETLLQMSQTMIESVDFSSLSPSSNFNIGASALSPAKFAKKKRGVLNCLGSFVHVLELCLKAVKDLDSSDSMFKAEQKKSSLLQLSALHACQVLTTLYTHVTSSPMIRELTAQLAPLTAYLYQASVNKIGSKLSTPQLNNKLEKLWVDMVMCFQTRFNGPYDSDFLSDVSPLLEATFLHPKRAIKNQTSSLWNTTFSRGAQLQYPEPLKRVLTKVKEKAPIQLPGWDQSEVVVIEDTPYSQASMGGDSQQVPLPHVPGMYSPHKPRGSFMNKVASPEVKKSPLKTSKSPAAPQAKRKLNPELTDMSSRDFVFVKTSPQKKRVLTEHQREVLKEKHAIPALYSSLDASVDVSLMGQFASDTQMSEVISDTPTDTPVFDITPFPFSKKYTKTETKPEETVTIEDDKEKSTKKEKKSKAKPKIEEPPTKDAEETEATKTKERKPRSRRSVRFSTDVVNTEVSAEVRAEVREADVTKDIAEFQSKLSDLKQTLDNSQEVDEIEKMLDADRAEEGKVADGADGDHDDRHDDVVEHDGGEISDDDIPMETDEPVAMETDTHDDDTPESSEPSKGSSESAGGQQRIDDMLGPHTFQSSSSQNMSDCSKEVATIFGSVGKSTRSRSPKKSATSSQQQSAIGSQQQSAEGSQKSEEKSQQSAKNILESNKSSQNSEKSIPDLEFSEDSDMPIPDSDMPSQDSEKPVKRGRGRPRTRPLGSKSPGRSGTPSKKPVDDRQSIDRFFTHSPVKPSTIKPSPVKLSPVKQRSQSFFSGEADEKLEAKPSGPAPVVFAEETQQFSPKGTNSEDKKAGNQVSIIVEETPAKDETWGDKAGDKDQASKNLFGGSSPDIIPGTQDSDDEVPCSQPFSVSMVTSSMAAVGPGSPSKAPRSPRKAPGSPPKAPRGSPSKAHQSPTKGPGSPSKGRGRPPKAPASPTKAPGSPPKAPASPTKAQRLDEGRVENQGLRTPTKSARDVDDCAAPSSPMVRLVRLSQEEIAHYSPKRNKTKPRNELRHEPRDRSGSVSSEQGDSGAESMAIKPTRVPRRGSLIPGITRLPSKGPEVEAEPGDFLTAIDKEYSKALAVEDLDYEECVLSDRDDNIEVDEDVCTDNKEVEVISISQTVSDTGVSLNEATETEMESSEGSQATIITRHRRRKPPTWLKDMHTPDSEKKWKKYQMESGDQGSESSQTQDSDNKPKKRGRKKKLNLENSAEWSQQQESKSQESQTEKVKEAFVPNLEPTFADDFSSELSQSQGEPSQSLVSGASSDGDKPGSSGSQQSKTVVEATEKTDVKVPKKRGRKPKLKMSESSPVNVSSLPVEVLSAASGDNAQNDAKQKTTEPSDDTPKSEKKSRAKRKSKRAAKSDLAEGSEASSQEAPSQEASSQEASQRENRVVSDDQDSNNESAKSEQIQEDSMEEIPLSELGQKLKASESLEPVVISSAQSYGGFSMSGLSSSDKSDGKKSTEASIEESVVIKDSEIEKESDLGSDYKSDLISDMKKQEESEMQIDSVATGMDENMVTSCELNSHEASGVCEAHGDSDKDVSSDADIFSSVTTSTPAKPSPAGSPDDQNNNSEEKKKKKGKRKTPSLGKQLNIEMKSPLLKRLRSQKPHLRTRALNRSLDSLQTKKKRSPKNNDTKFESTELQSQDDIEIKEANTALEELETEDVVEKAREGELVGEKVETVPSPTESEESPEQTSTVMDCLNAAKEPRESPVVATTTTSPPKKGKPFDLPDTPTSATKHTTMSRASLILQRARMMFAKPSKSPPSLRARAMARGALTDTKVLPAPRPGILKSPSSESPGRKGEKTGGSPTTSFRPIQMPRIYSPSASPSAGILRKRRLSGETAADSPSPPMKQRRVCFNDTVQTVEIPKTAEKPRQMSPRSVGRSSPKPVNRCLSMPPQPGLPQSPLVTNTTTKGVSMGTAKKSSAQNKFITSHTQPDGVSSPSKADQQSYVSGTVLHRRKDSQCTQSTMGTPSQATEQSTQESQLDGVNPICPELADCETSIDQILPQLTTSVWIRGLGQLVRSKNIKTIGKLCSMTEQEVHSLPIKSPKISTVRKALRHFTLQNASKVGGKEGETPKEEKEFKVPESPAQDKSLPPAEEELEKLSPIKTLDLSMDSDSNQELLEDIILLTEEPESNTTTQNTTTLAPPATPQSSVAQIKELSVKMTPEVLKQLPSHKLVELHQHLNCIMGNVVVALRAKCPSPTNSQEQ